jgi:hypothetical protein
MEVKAGVASDGDGSGDGGESGGRMWWSGQVVMSLTAACLAASSLLRLSACFRYRSNMASFCNRRSSIAAYNISASTITPYYNVAQ